MSVHPRCGVEDIAHSIVHGVCLNEEVSKALDVKVSGSQCEKAMADGALSGDGVKGRVKVFCGGREYDEGEALAACESDEIPGVGFRRGGEKVRHFNGDEEGGSASDTNGLDCVRDGTVSGEAAGIEQTAVDNLLERTPLHEGWLDFRVVLDVFMDAFGSDVLLNGSLDFAVY